MCGHPAQVSDWTTLACHLQAALGASGSEALFIRDVLRLLPLQGDSGPAVTYGVVPGVVPWRRGRDQPAFSDCAAGEELADECWFAVRPSQARFRGVCFFRPHL